MAQYNKATGLYVDRNNDLFDVVMLANKDGSVSGSSSLLSSIAMASGTMPEYRRVHKFGAVPAMSSGTSGSIWDVNDTYYPWSTFDGGGTVTIETRLDNGSLSTLDNGLNIKIIGLDNNYNEIEEIVTVVASTGVGTTNFFRINSVNIYGPQNNTNINVLLNGNIVQRISIGEGQSMSSNYTVPAGWTAYLLQGTTTCSYSADATVDMYVRPFGNGFLISHTLEVSGPGGQYMYNFSIPIKINEKSDIDIRTHVRTNNARVTAAYDIILVQNVTV